MHEDDELQADKLSAPLLVPQALLDDCYVNLLDFLRNPYFQRPAVVLTRGQKLRNRVSAVRLAMAERAYRLISGRDAADERWDEE